jgi:hypothetical protein
VTVATERDTPNNTKDIETDQPTYDKCPDVSFVCAHRPSPPLLIFSDPRMGKD